MRARLNAAVGGTVVSGRVTYHQEVELLPPIAMERGVEGLLGSPQIAGNATAVITPGGGWVWDWGEAVPRKGVSRLLAVPIGAHTDIQLAVAGQTPLVW